MSAYSGSREARAAALDVGRRFAVSAALAVALESLLVHAPLALACLRGAATLLLLALGARLGAAALALAIDSDLARERSKEVPRT